MFLTYKRDRMFLKKCIGLCCIRLARDSWDSFSAHLAVTCCYEFLVIGGGVLEDFRVVWRYLPPHVGYTYGSDHRCPTFSTTECLKMVGTYHSLTCLFWSCCPNPFTHLLVMQQQLLIFRGEILGDRKQIRWSHFLEIFPQFFKNLSTVGLYQTVKKHPRNFFLDSIQEPLPWSIQNTPYFNLSNNSSTFSGGPKFRNFQNFN